MISYSTVTKNSLELGSEIVFAILKHFLASLHYIRGKINPKLL